MSRTTPNIGLVIAQATDTPDVPYWLGQLGDRLDAVLATKDDTSGIVAQAGWSVTTGQVFVRKGVAHVYLNVTRTGAAIASATSGNITNVNVCQLPAAYAPLAPVGGATTATGIMSAAYIWTDAMVGIGALPPGVGIATNDALSWSFVYPLANP